jgi:hypothetical protein
MAIPNVSSGNGSADIRSMFDAAKSKFCYHPEYDKQYTKTLADEDSTKAIKTLSKQEVIYLYERSFFTDSDLQIVKLIADHLFATQGMIEKSIRRFSANSGSEQYVPIIGELKNLKTRLTSLVKAGILVKYLFDVPKPSSGAGEEGENGKFTYSYYLVSPHGYNFLKRVLNYGGSYDEYLSITPLDEVFKYLSTNAVGQALYDVPGFLGMDIQVPFIGRRSGRIAISMVRWIWIGGTGRSRLRW